MIWSQRNYILCVVSILVFSFLTKMWHIDYPNDYIFDEDYQIETSKLILAGDNRAFEWWHAPISDQYIQTLGRPTSIEWLHPPVAKYIQATSLKIFGDNAIGWRLASVLLGTAAVGLLIWLTFILTQNSAVSLLAGLLSSLDGFLFVQSRIASNDITVVFFVLLAVISITLSATRNYWLHILIGGICIGLAIGSKWSGAFIIPAIAIWQLLQLHFETENFGYKLQKYCILMLSITAAAALTYLLIYSPVLLRSNGISQFLSLHRQMIDYQLHADFFHSYKSYPWEWVLNSRPVKYYVATNQSSKEFIYNLGNPALHIFWIVSLGYYIYNRFIIFSSEKQFWKQLDLIFICYISLLVPWFFIARPIFSYHYLPAASLISIPIAVMLYSWHSQQKIVNKIYFYCATLLIVGSYVWWLPIWTGQAITHFSDQESMYFILKSWR